jgi:ferrous iron transport protein A
MTSLEGGVMEGISLSKAPNAKLRVLKILGGENLFKKLSIMGIYEGVIIEKKLNYKNGPVLIKVANSEIAIGRGMSNKIVVKEEK